MMHERNDVKMLELILQVSYLVIFHLLRLRNRRTGVQSMEVSIMCCLDYMFSWLYPSFADLETLAALSESNRLPTRFAEVA